MKVVMSVVYEIQPAVITTFALSDLMALFAQKYHAPPAVAESSRLIGIANLRQFCYLRRKLVISNSVKAENCDEYTNERYGSTLHRYSSRLGTERFMSFRGVSHELPHESFSTARREK